MTSIRTIEKWFTAANIEELELVFNERASYWGDFGSFRAFCQERWDEMDEESKRELYEYRGWC